MEVSQRWVKMVTFYLPVIFWSDLRLCPSYDSWTTSIWPECVWVDLLQCKQRKKVKEIISPIRSYYCGSILLLIAFFFPKVPAQRLFSVLSLGCSTKTACNKCITKQLLDPFFSFICLCSRRSALNFVIETFCSWSISFSSTSPFKA